MLIKYADIEVTLSLMSKSHTLVYAWELPLVMLTHDAGNVRIYGYQWIESTKAVDPQSEYTRLEGKYKAREQNQVPPMLAIYGHSLNMHQTLLPLMRECIRMKGDPGPAAPLPGYEANARLDIPRESPLIDRMAWLGQSAAQEQPTSQGAFGSHHNAADNADNSDEISMTVSLPPGLPVDAQGRLSKANAEMVLLAMGSDPDPEMSHQEVKNYLGHLIIAELSGIAPDSEIPEADKEGNYSDRQLGMMYAALRATGYEGNTSKEAA